MSNFFRTNDTSTEALGNISYDVKEKLKAFKEESKLKPLNVEHIIKTCIQGERENNPSSFIGIDVDKLTKQITAVDDRKLATDKSWLHSANLVAKVMHKVVGQTYIKFDDVKLNEQLKSHPVNNSKDSGLQR